MLLGVGQVIAEGAGHPFYKDKSRMAKVQINIVAVTLLITVMDSEACLVYDS